MSQLEELLGKLRGIPEAEKAVLAKAALDQTEGLKFVPSPGPQTEAWHSKADVLLYGGEAGGGKSGLLCGLALTAHRQTLLMRRNGVDLEGGGGLIEDLLRLHGSRDGYSGKAPPTLRTEDNRIITFGSATNVGDEQKYQGRARDLLGVDEATQFAETQIRFLMGWVRTVHEGQRTRSVLATNPPMSSEGDWVIGMFRPWLDITHHNPAKHGELRWFVTVRDGHATKDIEVDGPEPVEMGGETLIPHSRTFIPAALKDNPFIIREDYQKQLDALPEPYRSAARDGNFMAARVDHEFQAIPTAWVQAAMDRWSAEPPEHAPMSAISLDPAQGGADDNVIATRFDAWFDHCDVVPGAETPRGDEMAGRIILLRTGGAAVVVDMGGGYGGPARNKLVDNGIEVHAHKGSMESVRRTEDQAYGFANKRTEVYWRFREALDPSQEGGSQIYLPPDPALLSDLTAPRFEIRGAKIHLETKKDMVKRLGRSPDRGDAVVNCWSVGPKLITHGQEWRRALKKTRANEVTVNRGRMGKIRRRPK